MSYLKVFLTVQRLSCLGGGLGSQSASRVFGFYKKYNKFLMQCFFCLNISLFFKNPVLYLVPISKLFVFNTK